MDKSTPPWFRNRRYLHFDRPVGFNLAQRIVTSPTRVAQHAFYPLIAYQIEAEKIRRNPDTKLLERKSKTRPIKYPAHLDSHIYAYYAWMLGKQYEQEIEKRQLSKCILAFRPLGQSNIDFAHRAFSAIAKRSSCAVVALDITGFFDNLDHKRLKTMWCKILRKRRLPDDHYCIYSSVTSYSYANKEALYNEFGISPHNPKSGRTHICSAQEFRERVRRKGLLTTNKTGKGIPQGTPISALLSNIYMFSFDEHMEARMEAVGGEYMRYCDDMLLIVPLEMKNKIAGEVRQKIKRLKLDINTSKTQIHVFEKKSGELKADKSLQYLGFIYDGQQVTVRSAALAKYFERMKSGVRLAKNTKKKYDQIRLTHGQAAKPLYRRKLYQRYSHFGRRNFIRYALKAAKTMKSKAINRQLKPLWQKLLDEIKK